MMVLVTVVSACLTVSARIYSTRRCGWRCASPAWRDLHPAKCGVSVRGTASDLRWRDRRTDSIRRHAVASVTRERRPRKFHWQRTQLGSFALAGALLPGLYCLLPLVSARRSDRADRTRRTRDRQELSELSTAAFEIASVVLWWRSSAPSFSPSRRRRMTADLVTPQNLLIVSMLLFCIGLYGLLTVGTLSRF